MLRNDHVHIDAFILLIKDRLCSFKAPRMRLMLIRTEESSVPSFKNVNQERQKTPTLTVQTQVLGCVNSGFDIPLVMWSKACHQADHLEPSASGPHKCTTVNQPTEDDVTLHSQAEMHE